MSDTVEPGDLLIKAGTKLYDPATGKHVITFTKDVRAHKDYFDRVVDPEGNLILKFAETPNDLSLPQQRALLGINFLCVMGAPFITRLTSDLSWREVIQ